MLFLGTLQELYYDRLMPTTIGSFANMVKAGNLIDHAIKNGKIDTGKSSSKAKRSIFQGKMKVRPKLCTSKTHPINPENTLHTRTTRIISHITQLRVIRLLLRLFIIHPSTKHRPYKHVKQLQTTSQALQGIITL